MLNYLIKYSFFLSILLVEWVSRIEIIRKSSVIELKEMDFHIQST